VEQGSVLGALQGSQDAAVTVEAAPPLEVPVVRFSSHHPCFEGMHLSVFCYFRDLLLCWCVYKTSLHLFDIC
jgi:hypothetical protein